MCRMEKFAKFNDHVGGNNQVGGNKHVDGNKQVGGNLFKKFNENVGRDILFLLST